jgi:transcription antitermination factor NusG
VNSSNVLKPGPAAVSLAPPTTDTACDRNWFAVFTIPQHEQSVVRHLDIRGVESFCPTYETLRVWRNRQRKYLLLPLFPSYLFVYIYPEQRNRVLQSLGVLQIVGKKREYLPLPFTEIDFLRSSARRLRIEPYRELLIGNKVRIKSGLMQGIEGILVRKNDSLRFVLTIELINQHAAIEVDADDLEPILS